MSSTVPRLVRLVLLVPLLSACAHATREADTRVADTGKPCSALPSADRMTCYDKQLIGILHTRGVAAAMQTLDSLGAVDADVKREGHMYAHSIGLASFTTAEQAGTAFRQCLPIFQSGCYHGVIQSLFSSIMGSTGASALTPEKINSVCHDYRTSPDDSWLLFQCVHGMGHGLSQVTNHDLKATLKKCDDLESGWEREGCYGGAMMENAMEAFAPHHAMGRPETMDHSAMGNMDHADMDMSPRTKLVDPNDLLYPCSMLEDRYLNACYHMQTSVMLSLNHGDMNAAAKLCGTVDIRYRPPCFQSLGRDISAYTLQDPKRAAELCSIPQGEDQSWCHVGFVKNVIDVAADHRPGMQYCTTLTAAGNKRACYYAVGEELSVLIPDAEKRAAACGDAEAAYRSNCVLGARLPSKPKTDH